MNEIALRRCANCAAFNEVPGVACSMGGSVDGHSPAANDVCPQHRTAQEAANAEYARAADIHASTADRCMTW